MPKDTSIKSILLIGSGPIVIGQACEFDYAGSQASRSLREEGIEVTLINSNPATIMTDKVVADNVYLKPLEPESIREILEKHSIDAVLPTMGGQTALNTTLDLNRHKILQKYNVQIIGANQINIYGSSYYVLGERELDSVIFDRANFFEPLPKLFWLLAKNGFFLTKNSCFLAKIS